MLSETERVDDPTAFLVDCTERLKLLTYYCHLERDSTHKMDIPRLIDHILHRLLTWVTSQPIEEASAASLVADFIRYVGFLGLLRTSLL